MVLTGSLWELDPDGIHLNMILHTPSPEAWFGYDDLGRFIFDRLIVGARTSFIVAVSVVSISLIIGVSLGAFSAYYGGRLDYLITGLIDIVLAFPGMLLAIALAGIMGPGMDNVIFALVSVGWVGFARLTRAQILSVKNREHVLAATALGVMNYQIVIRHLIPMASTAIVVEATFGVASVIVAESGLSFLGLGVQPPTASWGSMIRDGTRYMLMAPHTVILPGMALMLVVLAVNLLGDYLNDRLQQRSSSTR